MFEELYQPLPDPARYWEKIGVAPPSICDEQALDRIIFAHQCAIPFENLDACDYQKPISLGIEDLFAKIIEGQRGGYCFELNALFNALLVSAGFSATPCFARSLKDRGFTQPVAHRASIVQVYGRKYFCDVGYGGPAPSCAMPLAHGAEIASRGQVFRIERAEEPWWRILYCGKALGKKGREQREPEPVLAFMDAVQDEVDFVALSLYCSTHPTSIFARQRMLNRRTPDGSVSVAGNVFTRVTASGKERKEIASEEDFRALALDEFGIAVP